MATKNNVETKRMGNFDMASAADRNLKFREDYPNSKIATTREKDDDGLLVFKSYIWKDKEDYMRAALVPGIEHTTVLSTADSEGTAKQAEGKAAKKDFEKLETISVGRALAFLGYLKDGQVASTEEMENFNAYKVEKLEEETVTALEYLEESTDVDDLRKRWLELGAEVRLVKEVEEKKDLLKANFEAKAKKAALKEKK